MVRIPQISSLETAIRIYYERTQLTNADIKQLFGAKANTTIVKLKEAAREVMRQENAPMWNATSVDTESAYKAWGLNIADLERRYRKLAALNLRKEQ